MPSKKLKVVVTRRLPDPVGTRLRELFVAELNLDDKPFTADELVAAIAAERIDQIARKATTMHPH